MLIDGHLWIQYIGFVMFVLCRMDEFSIINTLPPILYKGTIGLNKAWGIIYSVSGLVALVLDRFLTILVSNDPAN